MSKKVAILEGDKSRRFGGVKYLRTNLSGGGTCEWVPESEKKLTTKTVKKNGTYNISDEKPDKDGHKYYGFSQFTVNVKNSTTGKKNPSTGGDGNEYSVKPNEDTGMLEETVLPSSIRVVTQPSKTEYTDGESISLDGAVIKAYKSDGSLWEASGYSGGVVPNSEITTSPTIAESEYTQEKMDTDEPFTSGVFTLPVAITRGTYTTMSYISSVDGKDHTTRSVASRQCVIAVYKEIWNQNQHGSAFIFAASEPFTVTYTNYIGGVEGVSYTENSSSYKYNNKTVYYYIMSQSTGAIEHTTFPEMNNVVSNGGQALKEQAAWTMIYGVSTGGGSQPIMVKWERPEDNEELTDTFNISVI